MQIIYIYIYAENMHKYAKICNDPVSIFPMHSYAFICTKNAKKCKICKHESYMQNMQNMHSPVCWWTHCTGRPLPVQTTASAILLVTHSSHIGIWISSRWIDAATNVLGTDSTAIVANTKANNSLILLLDHFCRFSKCSQLSVMPWQCLQICNGKSQPTNQ